MNEMVSRTSREPNTVSALIDKMATQEDLKGFAHKLNSIVPPEQQGKHPNLAAGRSAQASASIALAEPGESAGVGPGQAVADGAEADVVARPDLHGAGDPEAVQVGAVHRAEVSQHPGVVGVPEFGVETGHSDVPEPQRRPRTTTDPDCRRTRPRQRKARYDDRRHGSARSDGQPRDLGNDPAQQHDQFGFAAGQVAGGVFQFGTALGPKHELHPANESVV